MGLELATLAYCAYSAFFWSFFAVYVFTQEPKMPERLNIKEAIMALLEVAIPVVLAVLWINRILAVG